MKKLLFLLVLVNLVFIYSCNNGGYCHVEGNIYEEGSNIPIHNVYVRINKPSLSPFKEATTDENGHYKITYFKGVGDPAISLDIISGEHISLFNKPVILKNANISAYLTPYGPVKFRVINNTANNIKVNVYVQTQQKYVPTIESTAYSDVIYNDAVSNIVTNKYCKLNWSYSLSNSYSILGTGNDSVKVLNKLNPVIYLIQIN